MTQNGWAPPIHSYMDFQYVRISEIPGDRKAFYLWISGRPRPTIPGLDPQDAVYLWDYERWLKHRAGKAVLWD